ncbi:membrane protein [Candidatus Magnetomorum sp. HK-1]|nr:membrane protein [Candidatus Magnetomorum sp. HK-1]
MSLLENFVKTVLYRDFWPIKGQQEPFEHFIQCKLYIYGSILILLILFFSGIRFLGTYNGLKAHLKSLEENPFASAILIKGSFHRKSLNKLKEGLFFNPGNKTVGEQNCENCIPAILEAYPYNSVHLRFLHDDSSIFHDTHEVLTVKVPDNYSPDKNKADKYIQKWITENLQFGSDFFHPEEQEINRSMILSPDLAEKLGYDPRKMNTRPMIYFLDTKQDIFEARKTANHPDIWAPLNETEKIKYTNHAQLFDVLKYFSGGDAIITEGFYYHLCKKFTLDPCKPVEYFYLKRTDAQLTPSEIKIVKQWAIDYFGNTIEPPHFYSNNTECKFQFLSYVSTESISTKCNIRIGVKRLQNKIPNISLDFKDDIPGYQGQEMRYYYAYLYINKDQRLLNNISKLTHFLKKRFASYLDDNQVMTLIKYRKDMKRMDAIFWWFFIGFILLVVTYIVVTFTLLLQTKRHQIGMFKSMGASSFKLIGIYISEALILTGMSIILAFSLSYCIPTGEFYSYNYNMVFYILCILVLTIAGAGFSAWYIVTRQPYQLISYQT